MSPPDDAARLSDMLDYADRAEGQQVTLLKCSVFGGAVVKYMG